jgi:hypothetical protein
MRNHAASICRPQAATCLVLTVCRSFDKDNIDAAVMKKIQTYTPQPDFQPDKIKKVTLH